MAHQQEFGSGRWQTVPMQEKSRVRLITFFLGLSLGIGSPLFGSLIKNPPVILLISLSFLLFAFFLMARALNERRMIRVPLSRNPTANY